MQTSNLFVVRRLQRLDETYCVHIYIHPCTVDYMYLHVFAVSIILSVCLVLQLSRTNYCGVYKTWW